MRHRCPPCRVCGKRAIITVDGVALQRWFAGELIQEAFPNMDSDTRELIVSGTHATCWNTLYDDAS